MTRLTTRNRCRMAARIVFWRYRRRLGARALVPRARHGGIH